MSKVKNLLLAVLLVLCAMPMLVACKDDSPVIDIDTRVYVSQVVLDAESKDIPLVRDTTYQLKYSFIPLEATNKTVEFSSSNPNVATVDKYGKVTAISPGSCNITVKSLDNKNAESDIATVTVVNEKEKLAKPTNLRFDGAKLSWSQIAIKSSSTFVPKYELSITCDGGEAQVYTTTNTNFNNFSLGVYDVTLRALGDEGNILYDNSDSTSAFTFTKLGNPTELNVTASGEIESDNPRNYVLSFVLAKNTNNIDDYEYRITPASGEVSLGLSQAQQDLWDTAIRNGTVEDVDGKKVAKINIPSTIAYEPVYIVFASKTDAENKIFGAGFENADRVQVGRLVAPSNLRVNSRNNGQNVQNILSWSNVATADKYKLKIVYKDSANNIIATNYKIFDASGVSSYDLAKVEGAPANYDSYDVYLYALGTSETTLVLMDSDSSLCARKQLSSVQGEISITADYEFLKYTVSWAPVENAKGYKLYISDNKSNDLTSKDLTKSYDTEKTTFDLSFDMATWNVGDNYIKIRAIAVEGSIFDDSNVSLAQQKLVKLKTPELKVSNGVIKWDAVNGAEIYTLNFGNGKTKQIEHDGSSQSFAYEPTSDDFNNESSCSVTITTINDSMGYIKSQASEAVALKRYDKISNLSVVDGNLTWSTISPAVEIRIIDTESEETLKTIENYSTSLPIADALKEYQGTQYSFSIRAISTTETSENWINGDWSDVIKTYQLPAPKNLRVFNGVLTWDKVESLAVLGANVDGIRYVIRVNEAENPVILYANDTSTVLQGLESGTNYSISIQTKINSEVGGSNIYAGTTDTYLINSLFSSSISVKLSPKPSNLRVEDQIIYWKGTGSSDASYKINLYKNGISTSIKSYENITSTNATDPSYGFSVEDFGVGGGNFRFVIQTLGDSKSYLNSYESDGLEICKLASPQITISSKGKISWTNSTATLGSLTETINKYILTVENENGDIHQAEISGTTTDLSFLNDESVWCGSGNKLKLTLQAISDNKNRVYNSDKVTYQLNQSLSGSDDTFDPEGSIVSVYKLPKINLDSIKINGQTIEWSVGEYANSNGEFNIKVYRVSDVDTAEMVVSTQVLANIDGKGSYVIPSSFVGVNYYIQIQQVGYEVKTQLSSDSGDVTESNAQNIIRYLTSEFSDAKYFSRLSEVNGVYLSNDAGDPILCWQTLNETENQGYKITLEKFDENNDIKKENCLTYYVPYNASNLGKYSLNLFEAIGTRADTKAEANIKTLNGGKYYGEYQIYINVVPKEVNGVAITTTTINGQEYLLVSSRTSPKRSMTIYYAPTINVEDNKVNIVNSNSTSRGVVLKFREVTLTDGNYNLVSGGEEKIATLSVGEKFYEVTESELVPGKLYQVSTQAIGNGANLVSSPEVISNIVVTKMSALEPNTVSATLVNQEVTNASEFDGWYVESGNVLWNRVTGATGYKIYMTSGSTTKVVFNQGDSSGVNSATLSNMGFNSNFGVFKLQFQVQGGKIVQTEYGIDNQKASIGYLSSDLSVGTYVNKLYTPNGTYYNSKINYQVYTPNGNIDSEKEIYRNDAYARIDENGEFDFGVRNGSGEWIDESGVTQYQLIIQGVGTSSDFATKTYKMPAEKSSQFIASEVFKTNYGTYMISMYSIGNNWYGDAGTPIYLTSDSENSFKIIYSGEIDDLGITDGQITWEQTDAQANNNYDLLYKVNGANTTVALEKNIFSFEGKDYDSLKGEIIDEVYVRFRGIPTENAYTFEGYVNTMWNQTPLTKIMKLPDMGTTTLGTGDDKEEVVLFINDDGQLSWTVSDELKELQLSHNQNFDLNISREVLVGNEVIQPRDSGIAVLNDETYIVPRVAESRDESGQVRTYVYDIIAYIRGSGAKGKTILASSDRVNDSSAEVLFINSSESNFRAGKINNPLDNSFKLDKDNGSMRVSWDLNGCSIKVTTNNIEETIEADKILLTYYIGNDVTTLLKKKILAKDFMFVNEYGESTQKGGTAFWQLGTFRNLKMTVLNSKGKAFGSEPLELDTASVEFNHFASGTGERNDPFVITNASQLSYMYWLPEKYFRLGNDIELPNIADFRDKYPTASINIEYPKEFYDTTSSMDSKYRDLQFYGGFDGNGHTIKNYQVVRSQSSAIWEELTGSNLEPLILENGEEFNDTVYKNTAGIITNLTVEVNTWDVSSIGELYNGILVSKNAGLIYNCHIKGDDNKQNEVGNVASVVENKFNVSAEFKDTEYYFGGIAGVVSDQQYVTDVLNRGTVEQTLLYNQIYVGRIENCTNTLNIKIYNESGNNNVYVGGIVGLVSNGIVVNCVNGSKDVEAGKNSGDILGFFAGGIAGVSAGVSYNKKAENDRGYAEQQYYSYIYGCKNYAEINTQCVYEDENVKNSIAGGIVGAMSYAYTTYCINNGTVTTDGYAAYLGGICGQALGDGVYISNTLNQGSIEYDDYYNLNDGIKRYVYAGALCGGSKTFTTVLYNSAINPDCIILTKREGGQQSTFSYFYDPSSEGDWKSTDKLFVPSSNVTLANITLNELQQKANINSLDITVDQTQITTAFENIDGLLPRFNNISNEWIIEWTSEHATTE